MLLKYSIGAALVFVAILLAMRWLPEPGQRQQSTDVAARVLEAVKTQDYRAFVALGDKGVRKMRAEDFQALVQRHASHLSSGHELQPLDERWRGGVFVRRWKLIFKDGSRDAILTLGVREGRVATYTLF